LYEVRKNSFVGLQMVTNSTLLEHTKSEPSKVTREQKKLQHTHTHTHTQD